MIGIYKITNKINQKSYIGQSINVERRLKSHKSNYKNKNNKTDLYLEMRKYGIENFTFEILKECSKEELNFYEEKFICYFDTFNNGYNLTTGGLSWKHRQAFREYISKVNKEYQAKKRQQRV